MKNWLQRTNRGVVLFCVLFLGVVIYCSVIAVRTKRDRREIENVFQQYVQESTVMYTISDDVAKPAAFFESEDNKVSYFEKATPLLPYLSSNEAAQKLNLDVHYDVVCAFLSDYQLIPKTCERQIDTFEIQSIYMDSAHISAHVTTTLTLIDQEGHMQTQSYHSCDEYMLSREDGQWKIISTQSNLITCIYGY